MMELHLIRHGKTPATEQKLYCGQTDLPLSERGVAEITLLKHQGLYPQSVELFFTSGMTRTEQTLDLIYGDVPRKAVPYLAEFKFGLLEMHSHEDLKGHNGYQRWIADQTDTIPCPNGESKKQFAERTLKGYSYVLNGIGQAGNCSAVVLCHGGTIACIMAHLMPNAKDFYGWLPAPGHGYTLTYTEGQFKQYKTL